jgi:integrative and conjugative element protein (TIGR02256 family)
MRDARTNVPRNRLGRGSVVAACTKRSGYCPEVGCLPARQTWIMQEALGKAWLSRGVLREIHAVSDSSYPHETGGVLMGYWVSTPQEVVITAIIGPGPNAVHRRHDFLPDHDFQSERIAEIYQSSGRMETYLGDWHTHPQGSARLSCTDRMTLRRIRRTVAARTPWPLMLIVSGSRHTWVVNVWCYRLKIGRTLFGSPQRMHVRFYGDEPL